MKNYIVQFKLPFKVANQKNKAEAFKAAAQLCEEVYGYRPSPQCAEISEIDDCGEIIDTTFFHPIIEYKNYE